MSGTFSEIGVTGLETSAGHIHELSLKQLRGRTGIQTFKEMREQDPIIAAAMLIIDVVCRQVEWRVDPYSEDADDLANGEFVESCLDDMSTSWDSQVSEILSFLAFGWSWHEILYKRRMGANSDPTRRSRFDDGLIGWRRFAIRSQESLDRWDLDPEDGSIDGMYQRAAPNYELRHIPIEKSLLFRTTAERGNPEGRSLLIGAYRPWYIKKHIENVEALGIERDLAGFPVMYVPAKLLQPDNALTATEKATRDLFLKLIKNVRRDKQEGVLLPSEYDQHGNLTYKFDLITSGGQRQFDTDKIIARYNMNIAAVLLVDFILLGHEKVGSFALSSDKTDMFALALSAFLGEIVAVINAHAIPRLFALNGLPTDRLPSLAFGDIEDLPLEDMAAYITALAGAGMPIFPDEALERALLERVNLPFRQDEGDEPARPIRDNVPDAPESTDTGDADTFDPDVG